MNDKIIQILEYKNKLLGLSDSGKVYKLVGEEWIIATYSPNRDKVVITKEVIN